MTSDVKKFIDILKFTAVFLFVGVWIYIGWPKIWQNPPLPPPVQEVNALDTSDGDGLLLYDRNSSINPIWGNYNNSNDNFSTSTTVASTTIYGSFMIRTSPTQQEAIAGYISLSGKLQVICYNGTSWTNEWATNVIQNGSNTRPFDIAYETNSGDVMILYSANTASTSELSYRTKSGTTGCGTSNWSSASALDPTRTNNKVVWVKMAWDKISTSNEIAAIWVDAYSDLSAAIWSGTAWGNEPTILLEKRVEVVSASHDVEDFDVEYESKSGDIMVVWASANGANGTNGVYYATSTGGAWSATTAAPTFLDDATNLDISANPDGNEIIFGSIGNAGSDFQMGYWSGNAWTNSANTDGSSDAPVAGSKMVSTGWMSIGGTVRSVVVYQDSASVAIDWYTGASSTFTKQTDWTPGTTTIGSKTSISIQSDPRNKDRVMLVIATALSPNYLFAKRLAMDSTPNFTWSNPDKGVPIQNSIDTTYAGPFSFAHWRFIPSTVTCTTPLSSSAFGTIDNSAVYSATNSTTTITTNSSSGFTMKVYGAGSGSGNNPGLWKSPDLIKSPTSTATTTLTINNDGYGLQATTTTGNGITIDLRYNWATSTAIVGGLATSSATAFIVASSSAAVTSQVVTIDYRAAVNITTPAGGPYQDTVTFDCTVNP